MCYPNQLHAPSLCSQNPSQQDSIFGSHYSVSVHLFHHLSNNNEHIATLFIRHFDTWRMIFHFVHSRALSWYKKQRYVTFYFAQNSVSKLHFLDLHFPRYPIPYNFFWEFWLGTCLRTQWYYALRIHCDIFLSIYAYNTLLRISKYFNYFFSSCMWQFD